MEEIITIALEKDLHEILELQKKSFMIVAQAWNDYDIPPLHETLDEITHEFNADHVILKYVWKGKIAGSVRGHINEKGNCYVRRLAVDPDVHNRGIGRKLMLAIESYFPDCHAFELFTSEITVNSRHLYESIGYVQVGTGPADGVQVVYYEKPNSRTGR